MPEIKRPHQLYDLNWAADELISRHGRLDESGHILLSPKTAAKLALELLLEEYRVERRSWGHGSNPKIEALVLIANRIDINEMGIDFTEALEEIKAQRLKEQTSRESIWSILNKLTQKGKRNGNQMKGSSQL